MTGLRVAVAGGRLGGLCPAQGLLKAGVQMREYGYAPSLPPARPKPKPARETTG